MTEGAPVPNPGVCTLQAAPRHPNRRSAQRVGDDPEGFATFFPGLFGHGCFASCRGLREHNIVIDLLHVLVVFELL